MNEIKNFIPSFKTYFLDINKPKEIRSIKFIKIYFKTEPIHLNLLNFSSKFINL